MAWRDFYEKNKIWIIVIVVIIIAIIVYRYFRKENTNQNLQINAPDGRRGGLEKNLGFTNQPVTTGIQPVPARNPEAPNQNGTICMTENAQKRIADEINKKLQEINACDCTDACDIF